ncbi:MAG TPA: hypothetical protein VE360_15935, partial [Pyrinomonadaceae bacterium]|nr:hypothetical protein [Pyrinomonadaceae bacterium]
MHSLSLHPSSVKEAVDLEAEVARLEAALAERRAELAALQEGLREFKARYAQVVGSRLAELAEVEKAIREAEGRLLGVEGGPEEEEFETDFYGEQGAGEAAVGRSLRKLF